MKVELCLVVGLALATVAELAHSTNSKERVLGLQISPSQSNLQAPEEATELMRLLRQAWSVDKNVGARAANFASLAKIYLDGRPGAPYSGYQWSVVVNKKTLYHQGTYYAIFRVRHHLHTYFVRLFSTT